MFESATDILKDTPHAEQIEKLYIAVNLPDILFTKPADLLVGEPPQYETGKADRTTEQKRVNGIVEENDLNSLIHELTVRGGYNGDTWLKTCYNYRQDFSELALRELEALIRKDGADYRSGKTCVCISGAISRIC